MTAQGNLSKNQKPSRLYFIDHMRVFLTILVVLHHVAMVYGALDLGVICNTDSPFGRYCYPQKFFEMLACKTPVISASVGVLHDMLDKYPYALYQPDNPDLLALGIQNLLANPRVPDLKVPEWQDRVEELEFYLVKITQANNP